MAPCRCHACCRRSPTTPEASIAVVKDAVQLKDHAGNTRPLHDGEMLTYGRIRLEVRAPRAEQPPEPTAGLGAGVKRARARESVGARDR